MSHTPPTKSKLLSWRDLLAIHPAADLFPLLSDQELEELGADIKKNGLQQRVVILASPERDVLLDGRNRLDAMERVGVPFNVGDPNVVRQVWKVDPIEYVIGANIRRRHLTAEAKRELIAKLLKLDPSKSSNAIAKTVGASHNTVEAVRRQDQANCQIDNKPDRTEASGRKARGRKPNSKPVPEPKPKQIDLEEAIATADAEASAASRKAAYAAEERNNDASPPEEPPGGKRAKDVFTCLCWLVQAAGPDLGDLRLAEHLTAIAAAQTPDPFPVSTIDSVINLLTDVASRLRSKEVADPADFPDMPAFLQRNGGVS